MYENLKDLINSKNFELKDILYKINIVWTKRYITKEQMEELEELARQNAKAENSYDYQKQLDEIFERIEKLEALHKPEEPTEPEEEYPEFVQPTGAHDAYKIGDKITFNGKRYICKMNGCVWNPNTYPAGWEEVIEDKENNEESEVQE